LVVHRRCGDEFQQNGRCNKQKHEDISWWHPFGGKKRDGNAAAKDPLVALQICKPFDPAEPVVAPLVSSCLEYLRKNNAAETDGIFRISGDAPVVEGIMARIRKGKSVDLDSVKDNSVHSVAALLKRWFRELEDPICTYELYDVHVAAVDLILAKVRVTHVVIAVFCSTACVAGWR
jgi:hypothetical protein